MTPGLVPLDLCTIQVRTRISVLVTGPEVRTRSLRLEYLSCTLLFFFREYIHINFRITQAMANWTTTMTSSRSMTRRRVRAANETVACLMYVERAVAKKIDDQATALLRAKVSNLDFTTTVQPQSQSSFFKLPGEMRNQIYELVFSTHIPHSGEAVDLLRATPPSQGFLLSCQRIYTEARHMYPDSARHYWQTAHFTLTIDQEITYERMSSRLRLSHIRRKLDLVTHLQFVIFRYRDNIQRDCIEYTLIDTRGAWAVEEDRFPKCPAGAAHTCGINDCTRDTRYVHPEVIDHPGGGWSLMTQRKALALCEENAESTILPAVNVQIRWLLWRLLQIGQFGDVMTERARDVMKNYYCALKELDRKRVEAYEREREEQRLRQARWAWNDEELRLRRIMLDDCTCAACFTTSASS